MADLDARKQSILQAIVIEYVDTAEPIGSEALVQKYQLGVKSATVRNEMAELSDLGYLAQPHTSAGRIPSDLGYRYYVDRLIVQQDVDEQVKQRVLDSPSQGDALQVMLRDTVKALSRVTHLLGVATTIKATNLTAKTAIVSALGPNQALFVLVLSNGHVENQMIECPADLTLADVGRANELLGSMVTGNNLGMIGRLKAAKGGNPATDILMGTLCTTVANMAKTLSRGTLISEGEEFMFAQPEFRRDLGALTDLLHDLTSSDILYQAVHPGDDAQVVTIGRENRHDSMHQLSIVRQSFSVGENEAGVVALIGPTRMHYQSSIPLVNFTAQALTQSLSRFFG